MPVALGSCSDPSSCTPFLDPDEADRNLLIKEYNRVIMDLASASGISVTPPDLYDYFLTHQDEMYDNVHPDGIGYRSLAGLVSDAL